MHFQKYQNRSTITNFKNLKVIYQKPPERSLNPDSSPLLPHNQEILRRRTNHRRHRRAKSITSNRRRSLRSLRRRVSATPPRSSPHRTDISRRAPPQFLPFLGFSTSIALFLSKKLKKKNGTNPSSEMRLNWRYEMGFWLGWLLGCFDPVFLGLWGIWSISLMHPFGVSLRNGRMKEVLEREMFSWEREKFERDERERKIGGEWRRGSGERDLKFKKWDETWEEVK